MILSNMDLPREKKSEQMGNNKEEDNNVCPLKKEEVNRLNLGSTNTGQPGKVQCKTYTRKYHPNLNCKGKKCKKCFDCGESGHFKGAPSCKKPKPKKSKKKQKDRNKDKVMKTKFRRFQNKDFSDSALRALMMS